MIHSIAKLSLEGEEVLFKLSLTLGIQSKGTLAKVITATWKDKSEKEIGECQIPSVEKRLKASDPTPGNPFSNDNRKSSALLETDS